MNQGIQMLPTIKAVRAQEPDLLCPPFGIDSASSKNAFSAASNPFINASFGFHGNDGSLITYRRNLIYNSQSHITYW